MVNPHPMLQMPLDIIREIFEVAARFDPDLSGDLSAVEGVGVRDSSNIKVAFDEEDVLEALPLALLLSSNLPLDIVLTGVRASRSLLDEFVPHTGRIRSLSMLSSLTALVINTAGMITSVPLQLPSVKSCDSL